MIRQLLPGILLLSASLACAASMPAPTCITPGKKFDSRFIGNWEIEQWQVRYSIRNKGKQICLYGRDVKADEWFEVPEIQWDGKALQASFYLPSTKWRTQSRLTVEKDGRIRDDYNTRDGKQTDYWTRRK